MEIALGEPSLTDIKRFNYMMFVTKNTAENGKGSELFRKFVATTGLSPIFAESSIRRACKRAGVDPEGFSKADIQKIISDMERILSLYLPPNEVQQRLDL